MVALMHIGVALSLALLFFYLWYEKRPPQEEAVKLDDEEISSHPLAIGIWSLENGETVHCQTAAGMRFSFRVVDRIFGYFELRGHFAERYGGGRIGTYVLGTIVGDKVFPRQFVPGGGIHFVATVDDDANATQDIITDPIVRLIRTSYDGNET